MIDLSNYSCDKCKREFTRHCKHCLHTSSETPTKFKSKGKIGYQAPKFRKPTPAPKPNPNPSYVPPPTLSAVQPKKKDCIYKTPCGWCTKWDKKCDCKIGCDNPMKSVETLSIPMKNYNKPIDIHIYPSHH